MCQDLPSHRATAKVDVPGLAGLRGPTIQMPDDHEPPICTDVDRSASAARAMQTGTFCVLRP